VHPRLFLLPLSLRRRRLVLEYLDSVSTALDILVRKQTLVVSAYFFPFRSGKNRTIQSDSP
jgi:hypothetical protein